MKTPAGVCRPSADTVMLTEAALLEPPCTVLDMGTGSGYSAIELAGHGFSVDACDICGEAVDAAAANAASKKVKIRFFQSDLWSAAGRYDLVIFNPPLTSGPALLKGVFRRVPFSMQLGPLAYMFSGDFRRQIVDRFIAGAREHLTPGGRLLMVVVKPELAYVRERAAFYGFAFTVVWKKGLYSVGKCS